MQNKGFEDAMTLSIPMVEELDNIKLPSPEMVTFWRNYKDRILVVDSDIDDNILEYVKMIIQFNKEDKKVEVEDRKVIRIYLYSYGGDLSAGNALIDAIEMSKTPVYIYNLGQACSMGALIAMAGTKRYCMPKAQYLIHQGQAGVQGQTSQVIDIVDAMKKVEADVREYVLSHTKIDKKLFTKNSKKEWTLSAQEALNLGVCDEIISSLDDLY